MEEDQRALERIERRLRERWPDLYMKADPAILVLKLYGKEITRQLAMAKKLAAPTAIEVVHQYRVFCSQSAPFEPSVRRVGEPAGTQPRIVGEDGRGVVLFCASIHEHDWGDYKPLNPHLF